MASNYVTSDGVDLDSRYLGIKAKAESAKTADTVNTSSLHVNGKDYVTGSTQNHSYTFPQDCYIHKLDAYVKWSSPTAGVTFNVTISGVHSTVTNTKVIEAGTLNTSLKTTKNNVFVKKGSVATVSHNGGTLQSLTLRLRA